LDRHLKCCKGPSAVALELMKEAPTKGDREHGVCDAGGARFRGDKQWETGYTSVQRKNDGVIPRLCFVHIGKCGGGTMNDLLMGLSGENRTRVFMLGGGNHTVGSIFQSPTYIQLHVTQLKQGTPLTVECLQKRLVILWLCDPVKRFISSFRFTVELPEYDRWYVEYLKHQNMNTTRRADLDYIVSTVEEKNFSRFVHRVSHGRESLSWYLGDCSVLDDVPNLFVGRMECFEEDYAMLLQVMNLTAKQKAIPHNHSTKTSGIHLARGTIDVIRELEQTQADYKCMQKLAGERLISQDYVDQIVRRQSYSTL